MEYFSAKLISNLRPSVTITPIYKENREDERRPEARKPEVSVECIVKEQEEPVDLRVRRVDGWSNQSLVSQDQLYDRISSSNTGYSGPLQVYSAGD